jgi:hypothetical protein
MAPEIGAPANSHTSIVVVRFGMANDIANNQSVLGFYLVGNAFGRIVSTQMAARARVNGLGKLCCVLAGGRRLRLQGGMP